MSSTEMRSLITKSLEDALASARGLSSMRSITRDSRSLIQLDFAWGEDSNRAAARVRELVDAVYPSLPEGAERPIVLPVDNASAPLLVLAVTSTRQSVAFTRRIVEYEMKARLRQVAGVGMVSMSGGSDNEIVVLVDVEKAAARQVDVSQLAQAIGQAHADIPAGSVRNGRLELSVVARGRSTRLDEFSRILLNGPSGAFPLDQLARVVERPARQDSLFLYGGSEQICLEVYARADVDPVATARELRGSIADMSRAIGDDIKIEIVRDESLAIASSVQGLGLSIVLGAIAAIVVLLAALRSLRAGFLVSATIPLSAACSLVVLSLTGRSLNSMSLGGIGLAIGLISDNAVVVLDAIVARVHKAQRPLDRAMVVEAVMEVAGGTFGSTITTAVVFVPILFLPGALGALFADLAISLIVANTAGWIMGVFALPSLYFLMHRPTVAVRSEVLERKYGKALATVLRRPQFVIVISIVSAILGLGLILQRPVSFMPEDEVTEYIYTVSFPAGTTFERISRDGTAIQARINELEGISHSYGVAGAEVADLVRRSDPAWSPQNLVIYCFVKAGFDSLALRDSLFRSSTTIVPADCEYFIQAAIDPAARLLGIDSQQGLVVRGDEPDRARENLAQFKDRLRVLAGDAEALVQVSPSSRVTRILVIPLRERLSLLGLDSSQLASAMGYAAEGAVIGTIELDGISQSIRVAADPARLDDNADAGSRYLTSIDAVRSLPILLKEGLLSVGAIANFVEDDIPAALARIDRRDVLYVRVLPPVGQEKPYAKMIMTIKQELPFVQDHDESALKQHGKALLGTIILVIVLLYLVLSAQFESLGLPALLLTTIPLALAGAGPALILGGAGLDSGSVLGLVVLFGVAVNNAIIMFETTQQYRMAGCSSGLAAWLGATKRIRPILATTATTIVALVPMIVFSAGAAQRSMSLAMLGGLFASTVLSLFLAPVLFNNWLRNSKFSAPAVKKIPEPDA
ncbi:MAG: hypothetical protein A2087_09560 [Spirochaetes bacterium GWD1_61_31]|nr:MAG: hypothetical protein A2Y37_07155 [Spirochaetes bacterium GWB1_60_80]OHD29249.1 MAG: hypothetical protein A2004_09065 [Spirochaetes bacterium GWC1_61_12]OHD39250.1 MAG: hypothetical protein A2087_09560 [Spirochaetes bacterium GWD1_61_31]OHD43653.1 MAG: hypothetical protein A2Y35_06350 [Spirochaetes bacterium GWE1_60_18]OHD59158.1 MAG: hypothetical protein A2Y32_14840 [Spirochaetes bacterium GWF1_60_12]